MYGCYDSVVVYGWNQGDRDYVLTDLPDDINTFARDVVRGHCGEVIYGVYCSLNRITGVVEVDDKEKMLVDDAFKHVKVPKQKEFIFDEFDIDLDNCTEDMKKAIYQEQKDEHEHEHVKLGYYNCLTGDYEIAQEEINFNESDNEEEESD